MDLTEHMPVPDRAAVRAFTAQVLGIGTLPNAALCCVVLHRPRRRAQPLSGTAGLRWAGQALRFHTVPLRAS